MKYMVYKKRVVRLLWDLLILDVVLIFVAVILVYATEPVAVCVCCAIIILLNISAFHVNRKYGFVLVFEDTVIKCTFLKRTKQIMQYEEIKEYGTVWYYRDEFIYISRIALSELQKNADVFRLHRKTKDVLILQYQEEAMNLLRIHTPNIVPDI